MMYRGGIEIIDRGQHEAEKTLGFTQRQTMKFIIIQQTIKRIMPPIKNETITLFKDTALVHVIGVAELLKAAKDAVNRDVNIAAYLIAACIYLVLTFILTALSQNLEKRFSRHEREVV